jgi:hypothetical protein
LWRPDDGRVKGDRQSGAQGHVPDLAHAELAAKLVKLPKLPTSLALIPFLTKAILGLPEAHLITRAGQVAILGVLTGRSHACVLLASHKRHIGNV